MEADIKKLQLIEAILKMQNETVLDSMALLLGINTDKQNKKKRFSNFAGTLTDEEVSTLERNIEEGCEQIHNDDWL